MTPFSVGPDSNVSADHHLKKRRDEFQVPAQGTSRSRRSGLGTQQDRAREAVERLQVGMQKPVTTETVDPVEALVNQGDFPAVTTRGSSILAASLPASSTEKVAQGRRRHCMALLQAGPVTSFGGTVQRRWRASDIVFRTSNLYRPICSMDGAGRAGRLRACHVARSL
jgi:hypothetical protein